jgi:hypothetical protein
VAEEATGHQRFKGGQEPSLGVAEGEASGVDEDEMGLDTGQLPALVMICEAEGPWGDRSVPQYPPQGITDGEDMAPSLSGILFCVPKTRRRRSCSFRHVLAANARYYSISPCCYSPLSNWDDLAGVPRLHPAAGRSRTRKEHSRP